MRILLYEWNSIGKQDLQDALLNLGHHVDVIPYRFHDFFEDAEFEKRMKELLQVNSYDCFISFNFFPILSKVCNEFHLKYIAWVWDSPLILQFFNIVHLPFNYLFIFDKGLYLELKNLGVNTIYHMPLAANVKRLDNIIYTAEDSYCYGHEVSFVGSLYENRNHFDKVPYLPDYLKGYFDAMMCAQMKIQGYNFIREMLTQDIMREFSKYATVKQSADYIGDMTTLTADLFFNTKITELERKHLLSRLSRDFPFTLYTDSKNVELPGAQIFGYADYYTVMPKIFRFSKINLNITLRTIRTGIPLRIFDVLGAGGFLITNYQSELCDYFELDRDLVCYESEEDLMQKVDYYLKHDAERKQIAQNGYEKVKRNYTYEITLEKILKTVFPYTEEIFLDDTIFGAEEIHREASGYTDTGRKETADYKVKDYKTKDYKAEDNKATDNKTTAYKSSDNNTTNYKVLDYNAKNNNDRIILQKKLAALVKKGCIEEADRLFHEAYRIDNHIILIQEFLFIDDLFDIYTFEKRFGLKTLFDIMDTLEDARNVIKQLVVFIKQLNQQLNAKNNKMEQDPEDISGRDKESEFLTFINDKQISYIAVEYIINKYTSYKAKMFNYIAVLFHRNDIRNMVIPFLMKANELDEKDADTLYNIAHVLTDWNEYDMAKEYLDKTSEKSERVLCLINRLYQENT